MPTCSRFFEELSQCLLKSDCVKKLGKKPSECLKFEYDQYVDQDCRNKQLLYRECRFNLLSPKKRFRGPFGGFEGEKEESSIKVEEEQVKNEVN